VFAMNEPPISGMGNIAGFDFRLVALDGDRRKLDESAAALVAGARGDERLAGVRNVAAPDVQTLFIDVDRNKAKSLGIPLAEVYQTIARCSARRSSPVHRVRHQPQGQAAVRAGVPFRSRLPVALLRAQRQGRHGAAAGDRVQRVPLGADRALPLQRLPVGAAERRPGAGAQLGRGDRGDGGARRREASGRHRLPVVRAVAAGKVAGGRPASSSCCRSSSCSCSSPRSTRASRCRSRCS